MRIPRNLRINADDFGISASTSEVILAAMREGLVNSTSVVPTRNSLVDRMLSEVCGLPSVAIGAHLTFVELPLVTACDDFPDGMAPPNYGAFIKAALRGRISLQAIEREWRAQLELLRARIAPRPIHHIDSHQHIHLWPGVWDIARALQREFSVPKLRCPLELTRASWTRELPLGAGLQTLAALRWRPHYETFAGFSTSMSFQAKAHGLFAARVAANPTRDFELMVHPRATSEGMREVDELRSWLKNFAY